MDIQGAGAGRTVRLEEHALSRVWRGHDDVARAVEASAGATPPTADAGVAGAGIRTVVAALGETTAGIARLHRLLACGVRDCDEGLGRTDDEVASRFRRGAGERSWP